MTSRGWLVLLIVVSVALGAVAGVMVVPLGERVKSLEAELLAEQISHSARREARIDLSAPADALIETVQGFPLVVRTGAVEPNAEGCRVTINVANPFGVGYGNGVLHLGYGETREETVIVSLPERLLPGSWTRLKVQLPVTPDRLRWLSVRATVDRLAG
jgi:hypothetical protein